MLAGPIVYWLLRCGFDCFTSFVACLDIALVCFLCFGFMLLLVTTLDGLVVGFRWCFVVMLGLWFGCVLLSFVL